MLLTGKKSEYHMECQRSHDAVPTILPNAPKYLIKKVPAERAPHKWEASAQLQSERRKRYASLCRTTTVLKDNNDDDCSSPKIDVENLGQLKTPSTSWSVHRFQNFEGIVYALTNLQTRTGTVRSDRAVLSKLSTTQEVSFQIFLKGKLVSEGAVMTVRQAEEALLCAECLITCPSAMSVSAIFTDNMTK